MIRVLVQRRLELQYGLPIEFLCCTLYCDTALLFLVVTLPLVVESGTTCKEGSCWRHSFGYDDASSLWGRRHRRELSGGSWGLCPWESIGKKIYNKHRNLLHISLERAPKGWEKSPLETRSEIALEMSVLLIRANSSRPSLRIPQDLVTSPVTAALATFPSTSVEGVDHGHSHNGWGSSGIRMQPNDSARAQQRPINRSLTRAGED